MKKVFFISILLALPLLAFAQDTSKKKAYYFYGEQCPHCYKVDEYLKNNGIYDKYEIKKLEVSNPFSQRLFMQFGEAFEDPNWGGVPAIVFGNKYLVGDQPIIDGFEKGMESVEAKEFPNPDKIGEGASQGNQESQEDKPIQNANGKKKNYFPTIMIALVVISAGALVYVNRKKPNA